MFDNKALSRDKEKKIEVFDDTVKNKIYQTMLLDELTDPSLLKPIGRKGEQLNEALPDDKINVQMYWRDQTKKIGMLVAFPSFIYLIILIGFNNNLFDVVVTAIAWSINAIIGFIPGI